MAKTQASVKEFAFIAFLLLAVLFGMQIMTFVFGSLSTVDFFILTNTEVINETDAYVNITGYTVSVASNTNFGGGVVATEVWADATAPSPYLIPAANYTMTSAGVLTNATEVQNATQYNDANVSYTWNKKGDAQLSAERSNNASLTAIGNYASQSGTQFTTLGVAITLVILVAVFLFFWAAFMNPGRKGKRKGEEAGSFS